jgi:hypothetical protein
MTRFALHHHPRFTREKQRIRIGGKSAAAVFVFGAVLTIEGMLAAMLSRRWFLRLSSILQLASFALFLSVWLCRLQNKTT